MTDPSFRTGTDRLRVLMVAPQPFFRARGTPFSVLHRIRAICADGHTVDLVTYPFGEDVSIPGLNIIRAQSVPGVRDVRIGPSLGKLLLDVPLYLETVRAVRRSTYDVLHSHEEAAFFCTGIAKRHGLIHVYDMHSSLPQQLGNFKSYDFSIVRRVFERLEQRVMESCDGVITICQELADVAVPYCGSKPHAMIENTADDRQVFARADDDVRDALNLQNAEVLLYTGTFERYQGLDLLLQAFVQARARRDGLHLLMVGGREEQIDRYRALCDELGIADAVTFVGMVHPSRIPSFLAAADAIVSPRSSGTNTPLKIYGYMRAGRPLVATDMPTHTQTLDRDTALLVPPTAEGLAEGMLKVMTDKAFASSLAENASRRAQRDFDDASYVEKVTSFYAAVVESVRSRGSRVLSGDAGA